MESRRNNMFKNSYSATHTHTNTFKNKPIMMEFPELSSTHSVKRNTSLPSNESLYSMAVKTADVPKAERETYGLEEGQVRFIKDPVTKETIIQSNYYPRIKKVQHTTYDEYVTNVFGQLIQSWDDSHKKLSELYGEDYLQKYKGGEVPAEEDESVDENIVYSDYEDE